MKEIKLYIINCLDFRHTISGVTYFFRQFSWLIGVFITTLILELLLELTPLSYSKINVIGDFYMIGLLSWIALSTTLKRLRALSVKNSLEANILIFMIVPFTSWWLLLANSPKKHIG